MYIYDRQVTGLGATRGFRSIAPPAHRFASPPTTPMRRAHWTRQSGQIVTPSGMSYTGPDLVYYDQSPGVGSPLAATKTRVRYFTCTARDRENIENALGMSVLPNALREAAETAAGKAVSWLWNAGSTLQVSPRAARTSRLFCEAFGATPGFVPTWRPANAKWIDRGDLVAIRLQSAARILDSGWIRYYCWGSKKHCPECSSQPPNYFACSSWVGRNVICLGTAFWRAWRDRDEATPASTLVHEVLHIYFGRLIAHGEKGRYGNANCYERFAMLINDQFLHSATDTSCARHASPC
jgi:hypothetical protein